MKFEPTRAQLLGVAYVILHGLSHAAAGWFQVDAGVSISIWYAPSGLALALLVLLGPRMVPLVFLTNFAFAWAMDMERFGWSTLFFPLKITAVYALTAWWVRGAIGPRLMPGGPRETRVFFGAIFGAPLVAALLGFAWLAIKGAVPATLNSPSLWRSVLDWWIGDVSGLLTVVPAAMVFAGPWLEGRRILGTGTWTAGRVGMMLLRGAALAGTVALVIAVPVLREGNAFYLCFIPLIWICMRHGLPGSTLATLLVMMVGLVGMRFQGATVELSYVFFLFAVAVAGVGLGLGTLQAKNQEAERKLATSEAQLDRVISGAQLGLWDWDIVGKHTGANSRLSALLGLRPEEMDPEYDRWLMRAHPADRDGATLALREHLAGRTGLFEAEFRMQARDGAWRWIESRGSVVERDAKGRPWRVSGTHTDITERKRAEVEVGRLLKIIEATPDLIVTSDTRGKVIYGNEAALAVWGRPGSGTPWLGRPMDKVFTGEGGRRLRDEAMPAAVAQGSWQGEIVVTGPGEVSIPTSQVVLAHRDPESDGASFSFIIRDISGQKRVEAERIEHERHLLHLQRAESLSVLAGGIAHDFNNLLTTMVGNSNLVRYSLVAGDAAHSHLDNIEQAATRASALCQQMLAYAGRAPVAFAEVDLNTLTEEALQLLAPGISKKITVQFLPTGTGAPVLAASAQLKQVVMNLALNAAEAIGDHEGRVLVRTRSGHFSEAELGVMFPASKKSLAAGNYSLLEVEDTGAGMTPEIQARIFEPFFTTKFAGQGLGLAAVSGVVRSHRGAIAVQSSPGAGTRFSVAFPAIAPIARAEVQPSTPTSDSEAGWRGEGLVLVVDDDALICQVAALLLKQLGFRTILAADGIEGVEAFRIHHGNLCCVLMDLTMPRMDGFEAHAEMNRFDPSVPVVLMSGYAQKLFNLPPEAIHPAGILAKPFGMKQLRERMAEVVGASAARRGRSSDTEFVF